MSLTDRLRRTNKIEIDTEQGLVFKFYRDYPGTVLPQVALGLRPARTLYSVHRAQTEYRRVTALQRMGFPLAQEYLDFDVKGNTPSVTLRYHPQFMHVEDVLRMGIPPAQARVMLKKCAAILQELHDYTVHGDPYLENFRLMSDNSIRSFDFEQEYNCEGKAAQQMDGTILFRHAVHLFRECNYADAATVKEEVAQLIREEYPQLELLAPRGRAYLYLRFDMK